MARINIDDKLFTDGRFVNLRSKHGEDAAFVLVFKAFKLAQTYWVKGRQLIPYSEFIFNPVFTDLIQVGLAEKQGDFVYVKGSKEQFEWIASRTENGKKGGRPKRKNNLNVTMANLNVTIEEPKRNHGEPKRNPLYSSLFTPYSEEEEIHIAERKVVTQASKEADKVLEYLNKKTGKNYSNKSKANVEAIKARLKEGFEESDFIKVIDNKAREWLGTDMEKYLRPITLFNASKFDGYRNEVPQVEEDITDKIMQWAIDNGHAQRKDDQREVG